MKKKLIELKCMDSFNLAIKSFLRSFDYKFIRGIAPIYILLVGIMSFVSAKQSISMIENSTIISSGYSFAYRTYLSLGALIFFPILISAFRAYEDQSKFKPPSLKIILIKSWKILISYILPSIFFFLGSIGLIVPGILLMEKSLILIGSIGLIVLVIFLSKRYLYVGIIAEHELLGPIKCMRRSRELSKRNGWSTILAGIYCTFACLILFLPTYIWLNLAINSENSSTFTALISVIFGWVNAVSTNCVLFYGYKNAISIS